MKRVFILSGYNIHISYTTRTAVRESTHQPTGRGPGDSDTRRRVTAVTRHAAARAPPARAELIRHRFSLTSPIFNVVAAPAHSYVFEHAVSWSGTATGWTLRTGLNHYACHVWSSRVLESYRSQVKRREPVSDFREHSDALSQMVDRCSLNAGTSIFVWT